MSASGGDPGPAGEPVADADAEAVDPYRELGVDPRAHLARIRAAYHAKARLHHPDLGGDPAAMARLNLAWETLRDPARRRQHDATHPQAPRLRRDAPPPWTGAAGPPPGKPAGPVLDFGIFAGWSIGEIARHDPGYLYWLAARPDGRPFLAAIERYLAPIRGSAKMPGGERRTPPAADREGPRWRR
jgi:curved DNA-binding protein CbpA